MAEVNVQIGGRQFEVACRDGEEHFLKSAAAMLNNEASALNEALGRMPEARMLLMAGLMLADKTASLEDQLKQRPADDPDAPKRINQLKNKLGEAQTALAEANAKLAETEASLAEKSGALDAANATRAAAVETMTRMLDKVEQAAEATKKAG